MMQLPKATELDPTEVGQSSPANCGSVGRRHALAAASMGGYLDRPLFPVNTLYMNFLQVRTVQVELLWAFSGSSLFPIWEGQPPASRRAREGYPKPEMKRLAAASLRSYRRTRRRFKGWGNATLPVRSIDSAARRGHGRARPIGPRPARVPSKFHL
jgi:hypothetical protein